MPLQVVCAVSDTSHVGAARRHAMQMATLASFGETEAGRVALVATELATNLVRHAGGGRLLLQIIENADATVIEMLSIDSGPGMVVEHALRDGFSTGGTAGQGLGAIQRLSQDFEIYSRPGNGCVVMARVPASEHAATKQSDWRWGAIRVAAPGETAIGDDWCLMPQTDGMRLMMADGLGHGPLAAEASNAASEVFRESSSESLPAFFTRAHAQLKRTRGAAISAALCPTSAGEMEYVGVGNIAACKWSRDGSSRRLMSHNGTVGAEMRPVKPSMYEWQAGDRIILHSDGLTTRWLSQDYADAFQYHPAILCALLFRDHVRGKDDATVFVLERPF